MNQPLFYSLCAPEHPKLKAPKLGFGTDYSPSLGHLDNPDADKLITYSQMQPYLQTARVTLTPGVNGFFHHVFLQDLPTKKVNLDLSDLKYNPSELRQAEVLLERKLNGCIDSLSPSKFIGQSLCQFLHTDAC
jgi:hypothetical protein